MFRTLLCLALLALGALAQPARASTEISCMDANNQPQTVSPTYPCPVVISGTVSTPTGTAGSPNAAVTSVQGVAGGTPQSVDPTGITAITPVVSGALEASHVLKAAAGRLYSVYASNLTGSASGFLLVLNATAKPGDGAVTPLLCVPFSGGVASANFSAMPPAAFSTGITAVVSTGATCFTQTSSVATAFISGMVQ